MKKNLEILLEKYKNLFLITEKEINYYKELAALNDDNSNKKIDTLEKDFESWESYEKKQEKNINKKKIIFKKKIENKIKLAQGFLKKSKNKQLFNQIVDFRKNGLSYAEISNKLNISIKKIRSVVITYKYNVVDKNKKYK